MSANDRIVQHLRLRAPSQQAATRVVNRLEDALRCASLPDAGERLLLVRRLDLGKLPAGLSSQSLSLLIEQRVMAARHHWTHGSEVAAGDADAVFFEGRWQAAQAAVLRRASEQPLTGWYWSLALPGVELRGPDGIFLDGVVACLTSEVHAAACLPALVAHVVQRGETGWLVKHLSPETVALVVACSGARRFMEAMPPTHARESEDGAGCIHFHTPAGDTVRLPVGPSVAWLRAVLRAANWREVVRPSARSLSKSDKTCEPLATRSRTAAQASDRPDFPESAPGDSLSESHPLRSTEPEGDAPQRPSRVFEESGRRERAPMDALQADRASLPFAQGPFEAAQATAAGGILFLLPVLDRLGFPLWQAAHDDVPLVGFVLRAAFERLQLPDDDPAWAMLQSLPRPESRTARTWDAAPTWRLDEIAVDHDPQRLLTPAQVAARWLLACRRYLRRVARIGLASLTLRTGRIRWSATHVDVFFALQEADLRVRRAALDLSPGWLPWLGRVVAFEFQQEGDP